MGNIVFEDTDGSSVTWTGPDERIRYESASKHWIVTTGDGDDLLYRMIPRERVYHVDVSSGPGSVIEHQ